ncbi:MAG: hypothetical protein GY750_16840 [Lentisphaerae bacterium]|nr:hypothetical protein [Lentisphaerota bacterium]MCP4103064.1 hypothetical protein [Lentisphaerota bacterium]
MTDEQIVDAAPNLASNPWKLMLFKPRATIQQIIDSNPGKHVITLAFLYGISLGLFGFATGHLKYNFLTILLMISIGGLLGMVQLFIYAWFVDAFSESMRGKATRKEIRAALAWGRLPWVCGQLFIVPMSFVFMYKTVATVCVIVDAIIFAWSFINTVISVSQVQGFSIWNTVKNIILAYIFGSIVLVIILLPVVFLIVYIELILKF